MPWRHLLIALLLSGAVAYPPFPTDAHGVETPGWTVYTNARFGFSIRYQDEWKLGQPLPDGTGVTLYPPVERSLVALSGHMNLVQGSDRTRLVLVFAPT